jgi:uncharacterized RDD family membrane protein YckC
MRYAGVMIRFWALVIDFLIFCAVFFPVTRLVKGVWLMSPSDHRWVSGWFVTDPLCLIFLAIIVAYFILLEAYAGATIGKRICGLRVVRAGEDGKPGLMKSFLRNIGRVIDSLPALNILGVVLIVASPEKARFGDRIANTRVVHGGRPRLP